MDNPGDRGGSDGGGMWPLIYPRLLELILAHRSTIVFVNSRRLAERVSQQLTELAIERGVIEPGVELVRAHHGSVARHQRLEIEEALKAGRLRAITATSSLELGIDMGAVDLVLQVESPGAVSRGLQRIGRAGHHVGGTSIGRILPKFRGDLLEATVVARGMLDGEVEAIRVPDSALDVLAQQIVAMVGADPWPVGELERVIRRAASYRELSRDRARSACSTCSPGAIRRDEFAELRPRLTWDRQHRRADRPQGRAPARRSSPAARFPIAASTACTSARAARGSASSTRRWSPRARKGETFILGATTWRIEDITRDRVDRHRRRRASRARCRSGAAKARAGRSSSAARSARSAASSMRKLATDRDAAHAWLAARLQARPARRART